MDIPPDLEISMEFSAEIRQASPLGPFPGGNNYLELTLDRV